MKLLSYSFLPLFVLLILSGCMREDSENVNQDRIWAHYELYYNGNEDITYARATFRFGHAAGTKLQLTDPSEVRFNGTIIPFRPALAYYERSLAGFVDAGTFEFSDMDGTTYINDAEIRVINHPEEFGPIDRSQSAAYAWDGNPLSEKEYVTLVLTGGNEGGRETFTISSLGSSELVLGTSQLQELAAGNGSAQVDLTYAPPIQQATSAGGWVWGRYRPVDKEFTLE